MQLGELEKLVLQYLWQHQTGDAKQVYAHFEKTRGGTLNTIQSTLDRLFKKDLLARRKQGHAYIYSAKIGREALIAQLIENVTSDFVEHSEHSLVAAFSSVSAKMTEQQLDQLEAIINQQRAQRNNQESE
ncbi:TrmB family transcriptional regulator [Thalassotalea sp. 42_200_T64]|nr:TrmB family transcriptional regulator [Thalassotalea sp. 42_200_T64]